MANERCTFWHVDGEGKKTLHKGKIAERLANGRLYVKPDVFGFLMAIGEADIESTDEADTESKDGQRTTSP